MDVSAASSLMKRKRPTDNISRNSTSTTDQKDVINTSPPRYDLHQYYRCSTNSTPKQQFQEVQEQQEEDMDDDTMVVDSKHEKPQEGSTVEATKTCPTIVNGTLPVAIRALHQAVNEAATDSSSVTVAEASVTSRRNNVINNNNNDCSTNEETGYTADSEVSSSSSTSYYDCRNGGYSSSSTIPSGGSSSSSSICSSTSTTPSSSAVSSPFYDPTQNQETPVFVPNHEQNNQHPSSPRTSWSSATNAFAAAVAAPTTMSEDMVPVNFNRKQRKQRMTSTVGVGGTATAIASTVHTKAPFVVAGDVNDKSTTTMWTKTTTTTSTSSARSATILDLGADVMANILTFVDPAESVRLLTAPVCKDWRTSYTSHQDLWRTLCMAEPFCAQLSDGDDDNDDASNGRSAQGKKGKIDNDDYDDEDYDDDDSFCSLDRYTDDGDSDDEFGSYDVLGEYRLMYTSFVRCINYLNRLHEDARKGNTPSGHGYAPNTSFPTFGVTRDLKRFLSQSKNHEVFRGVIGNGLKGPSASALTSHSIPGLPTAKVAAIKPSDKAAPSATANADSSTTPKYGNSMITARLLGPAANGIPSHLNLPRSCAIYSVVNWMVAHPDVEGIQIMCVASLPTLLEDEQQRLTAQRVGLIEVILSSMVRFPDSLRLHVAAFHTLVLLARPLGGREGMLFDNSMANSTRGLGLTGSKNRPKNAGSEGKSSSSPKRLNSMSGMTILIESMHRFQNEERLQAMACWAMVNLALVPSQKTMLMSLDAVQAAVNALIQHPTSFDVQFRALFALINLVVPCKQPTPFDDDSGRTDRDVLDDWAPKIAQLVVNAMENFCSSERVLNRACLVLHNLSQSQDYVPMLLWTPHLYQLLEWCVTNYPTDTVLRRSATSTLNRIQVYLSQHPNDRQRFLQLMAQRRLEEEQQRQQQEQDQRRQAQESNDLAARA